MNTSQHDLSSMQVLLRLLFFLEFNLFITPFIDRFVNLLVVFSWTSQFLTSFPDSSGTKVEFGTLPRFSRRYPPAVSEGRRHDEHFQRLEQHVEVHDDHRIVDPMLQTPLEKTCRQKRFERSADVFEVHQTVHAQIDSCSPEGVSVTRRNFGISESDAHATTTCASPKDICF